MSVLEGEVKSHVCYIDFLFTPSQENEKMLLETKENYR